MKTESLRMFVPGTLLLPIKYASMKFVYNKIKHVENNSRFTASMHLSSALQTWTRHSLVMRASHYNTTKDCKLLLDNIICVLD